MQNRNTKQARRKLLDNSLVPLQHTQSMKIKNKCNAYIRPRGHIEGISEKTRDLEMTHNGGCFTKKRSVIGG